MIPEVLEIALKANQIIEYKMEMKIYMMADSDQVAKIGKKNLMVIFKFILMKIIMIFKHQMDNHVLKLKKMMKKI